uniref:Uncharacterized protein n=1 Tax=Panagrolaimus sp. PS1159 TaxID=55785 RepID=A0AC35FUV1_9BILA
MNEENEEITLPIMGQYNNNEMNQNQQQQPQQQQPQPAMIQMKNITANQKPNLRIETTLANNNFGLNSSTGIIRSPASAVPERMMHSKKQLRKYASETSFAANAAKGMAIASGSGLGSGSGHSSGAASLSTTNEDLQTPPIITETQIRTPSRIFHVRPVPSGTSSRGSNGFASANAVINKINQNKRRQDSDEASGSIASENTVASGTMTPVSRRNLRFMKRPKSTGNMGYSSNFGGGHIGENHHHRGETTNSGGTMNAYDASFTSATIHSLDSAVQPMHASIPMLDERRPSNFYMMDDDSTHEFDDDMNGKF